MSCVTLLSDFGLQDASVAVARGILLQYAPGIPVVDISHEVRPFRTAHAAYLLSTSWRNFPPGSCHLSLFDLFAHKANKLVVAAIEGHYFIAADNGLLPLALGAFIPCWQYTALQPGSTYVQWVHAAATLISLLQATPPSLLGLPSCHLMALPVAKAMPAANAIDCQVIHIDHYENVVLDITRTEFEAACAGRQFALQFVQVEEINTISNTYADVKPGVKLCRFNASGYMEICVNRGNAASLFGLRLSGHNNDIKITFS